MKENKDTAFAGHLSQRRIWKAFSGAPIWVPIPIHSTQTSLVRFAFCLVPTLALVPLYWREKMKKNVLVGRPCSSAVMVVLGRDRNTTFLSRTASRAMPLLHPEDYFGHWAPTGKPLVPYLTFQPSWAESQHNVYQTLKIAFIHMVSVGK